MPSFLKKKSQPLLGIDISNSTIKVVELVVGDKTPMRLERYAVENIEKGSIVDGNIDNADSVAEALNRALKKLGSRTKNVAIALPSAAVITKRITLPRGLSEEDYEGQVETEASQYIPFPIEEVNLDFQILGPTANSEDDVDVLIAAARKEKVEDRVAVAEMAGLKPMVMDVEPFAARTALDHVASFLPDNGEGQILAMFQIGSTLTSLAVTLNGQTIFERQSAFGGLQLTQDIVRMYGIVSEEAEGKKRSGDLPDNYPAQVLKPFVEQAASEISRALQFFYTSTPYTRVDHIYVAGGSSSVTGLTEAISAKVGVPAEVFSPFQGMEVGKDIRERQLRMDAPSLLIACGLAMRGFDL
jgi:type IV pilus assembly protein PilM